MTTRTLTCIGCPMGCQLTVTLSGDAVTAVAGNTCRRGEDYARKECTTPMRTVTGTVATTDGRVVCVRTAGEVPKGKVMDVAEALRHIRAKLPVHMGDVIAHNVCGTGADIVATRHMA